MTTTKKMWMGTREHMVLVPCPDTGLVMNAAGWQTSGTYLNGGSYLRGSQNSHRSYQASWTMISRAEAQKIEDVARGAFGSGLIYMQEAFTEGNILPYHVSVPRLQANDAPSMLPDGRRPTLVDTFNNTQDFPSKSARFQLAGDQPQVMPKVYLPNPSKGIMMVAGYGAGATGGATLRMRPVGSTGLGFEVPIYPTNSSIGPGLGGPSGDEGYELFLHGTGTITLAGIVAMPVGNRLSPAYFDVPFISGRGTSGLRVDGGVNITGYSAPSAKDFVSVTMNLVEVGAWEQ